ncbi:EEF1A lysine methyltransferase 3 isoform X1 [Echeneis naucrates]|uniref:EEF1A lysine methyltransferase 3 isoform X1 n=1 Tax=Echeneis naucrates TaxID=173247 RepID=UPI00111389ED|nr:EEF1A lysine methyltransferase 3 isoform X1 [Echeneis naucrates]
MSRTGEEDDPFPADDGLFADTFSLEDRYNVCGEELKIRQLFGAKLGVAAPVWEAVREPVFQTSRSELCVHCCCFCPQGLQLCRYLGAQAAQLGGKRIIELGAGTGVVGILAARLGAAVTLTDLPLALPQIQANISANVPSTGWPSPPTVLPLSWGEDHLNFPSNWDLVLCADIVYLPETYPLLMETLAHLAKNGAVVYLSSKMRKEHGTPGFYEERLPRRFNVELLHRDDQQNINIYGASLRTDQQKQAWDQDQLLY